MRNIKQTFIYTSLIVFSLTLTSTAYSTGSAKIASKKSNIALNTHVCKTNSIKETTSNRRFQIINYGKEVKDKRTGLIWQRCSLGQTFNGSKCIGQARTYNWQQALRETQAVGNNYRLPNIKELQSIIEESCHTPAVNTKIFPNTSTGWYWSASPNTKLNSEIWMLHFGSGNTYTGDRNIKYYVRAVRSE